MRRVAIALVHHPVLDGAGQVVTTAVTSVDIHDIARSARTYGVERYYLVHPVEASRSLVNEVKASWLGRPDTPKNRARRAALECLTVVSDLVSARADFGPDAEFWSTSAQATGDVLSYDSARVALQLEGPPVLIVFGTGNGLGPGALSLCSVGLASIRAQAPTGYNHLSVRSAVAIVLDRLLGARP